MVLKTVTPLVATDDSFASADLVVAALWGVFATEGVKLGMRACKDLPALLAPYC